MPNLWISDPVQPMPQFVQLHFVKAERVDCVYATFDPNLSIRRNQKSPYWKAPLLVRDWRILAQVDGAWVTVFEETGNWRRRRIVRFPSVAATAIRLEVLATNQATNQRHVRAAGGDSGRIYEVRACTTQEDAMKKILNRPADFVDEMLQGILYAHPRQLRFAGDKRAIVRADAPVKGKVGIATGGGSGHLPVFLGYVGKGLLDGCAVGNVFSSPTANQMLAVTQAICGGAGVLYLYGNYTGDVMNFDMAAEMADMEDIKVDTVLVADDVASAPPERHQQRGAAWPASSSPTRSPAPGRLKWPISRP